MPKMPPRTPEKRPHSRIAPYSIKGIKGIKGTKGRLFLGGSNPPLRSLMSPGPGSSKSSRIPFPKRVLCSSFFCSVARADSPAGEETLRDYSEYLSPGIKTDPRITVEKIRITSSNKPNIFCVRHNDSFSPTHYHTLVYVEGSALWNRSYIDWGVNHAQSMLQALGKEWQVLVIQHDTVSRTVGVDDVINQVGLAMHYINDQYRNLLIKRCNNQLSLYAAGYSTGATLLTQVLNDMKEKNIDFIRHLYLISPIEFQPVQKEQFVKQASSCSNRPDTRQNSMLLGPTFLDFSRMLVSQYSGGFINKRLQAQWNDFATMYIAKKDPELNNQMIISDDLNCRLEQFSGDHTAWWNFTQDEGTMLRALLSSLKDNVNELFESNKPSSTFLPIART